MGLEEGVLKLMDDAVKADAAVLEALLSGNRQPSLDVGQQFDFIQSQLIGQRRAIQRIARHIDEARDA